MSVPTTAPGVYAVELPAGTRAITGVATSVTAFAGTARRGPVDAPTPVASWTEYESRFGSLWSRSVMGQVVRHFFLNGGGQALIVRVVNGDAMVLRVTDAAAALAGFDRLEATVADPDAGAGTFDLTLTAVDAAGDPLENAGGDPYAVTVTVDVGADPAAAIGGAQANATALVEVVGDPVTGVPPAGSTTSAPNADGDHVLTIGDRALAATATAAAGLLLRAAAAVRALPGFARLRAVVSNANPGAGTFDLALAAVTSAGTVIQVNGHAVSAALTGLDVDTDYAATIAAARATTTPPMALAEVVGTAPRAVPPNGTALGTTLPDGGDHVVTVATTALALEAASPGAWGNRVTALVDTAEALPGTFHLELTEVDDTGRVVAAETHYGVSADPLAPRWLGGVLERESQLAVLGAATAATAPQAPAEGTVAFAGGADGGDPRVTQDLAGSAADRTGLQSLVNADVVNIVCVPLESWSEADAGHQALWASAVALAESRRAFLVVDPPQEWASPAAAVTAAASFTPRSDNAALYYPRVRVPDPLQESRLADFPPCGVVAGVIARTDAQRGIWKAPAGIDAGLRGVPDLTQAVTDAEQGSLNQLGVNVLRGFPVYGRVLWGARTLNGADVQASQWKYVPVRRLALYLEESLLRGSRWAVFEPNGPQLWSQLRLSIGAFMHQLFRQGAFAGTSAQDAYLVKCDAETTQPGDIDRGIVNVLVGFAPLKPAEFVIIRLQQLAAQAGQ
jgi:phage tail sheath protein FI